MSSWISVEERMPAVNKLTKLHVRIIVGSIKPKTIERQVLVEPHHLKCRFLVGDWQQVTHWLEE